ncbi:MAG: acyltransferase [Planctomycetota bacterium]
MKRMLKTIAQLLCTLAILPAFFVYWLQGTIAGFDKVFPGWSQGLSLIPGFAGIYLRRAFYRLAVRHCGSEVCLSFGTIFSHPGVSLGQSSYIGNYCSIGDVTIEHDVLIASHVSIMNGCHQHGTSRTDLPMREQPGHYEPITIGEDSWIGEHSTVAASIGKHCIVGAHSLVLSPIPDYSIAVGSPARVIRDRRDSSSRTSPGGNDV